MEEEGLPLLTWRPPAGRAEPLSSDPGAPPDRLTHLLVQPLLSSPQGQQQSGKPGGPLLPGSGTGS